MRKEVKGNGSSNKDTISVNYADSCEETKDEAESDLDDNIQVKDGKPPTKAEAKKRAELDADANKTTASWKSQLDSRLAKVEQLRKQWQEIEARIQEEMRRPVGAPAAHRSKLPGGCLRQPC